MQWGVKLLCVLVGEVKLVCVVVREVTLLCVVVCDVERSSLRKAPVGNT